MAVRLVTLVAFALACSVGATSQRGADPVSLPHLFMDQGDVAVTRGLVGVAAGVLKVGSPYRQPHCKPHRPPHYQPYHQCMKKADQQ